jgi:DNA-binding transcriptional MerR regulator
MSNPIMSEYLSSAEAAKELNISKRTLVRWQQLREGPPITRIGRQNYYRISSLKKWLEAQERLVH